MMKDEIISAVLLAIEYHRSRKQRTGYSQQKIDSRIEPLTQRLNFIKQLKMSQSDLEAFNILTDRLTNPQLSWDTYSLNSYLIDELQNASKLKGSRLQNIDWNCFTPNALKTFQGAVYRGTSSEPEKVFHHGFQDYNPSTKIEDYLNPRNLAIGVSTSRSFPVAESYTRVISRIGKRRFVYTIIYLGEGGIDIIETAKARAVNLKSLQNAELCRAVKKDEINIIGFIPKEYIYCATEFLTDGQQKVTYNPNFNEQFILETPEMITHMPPTPLLQKIRVYFLNCLSHIKSFVWAIKNRNSIDALGRDYRTIETRQVPQMKEAELLFAQHQLKQKESDEQDHSCIHEKKINKNRYSTSYKYYLFNKQFELTRPLSVPIIYPLCTR